MTFRDKFLITLLAVLAILLALAAYGYFSGRWEDDDSNAHIFGLASAQTQAQDLYADIPLDAKLLPLDKRALDDAYYEHLKKLFSVWLTSGAPADAKQITNGLRISRRAYNQAASQIAKREAEIERQSK